jgi:hypothetical protein
VDAGRKEKNCWKLMESHIKAEWQWAQFAPRFYWNQLCFGSNLLAPAIGQLSAALRRDLCPNEISTPNPKRSCFMFTRVVEITSRSGKATDLTRIVENKVIPFLKSQPGFLDEITMFSDMNPNLILAISFWKTKDDAERYHQEQYKLVIEALNPVLESAPTIHTFFVTNSTIHNIASGKAA